MTTAACPKCHDEVTIPPGAQRAAQVRCPWCREEFDLSEILDRLPPMLEIIGAPSMSAIEAQGMGGYPGGHDHDFRLSESDDDRTSAPAFDFGGGTATAAPAAAATRPRTSKTVTTARPRRKEKSAAAEMVKVVLGGVVGLILAQMILWWLPEPYKRDPIEIGPTVGKYVPWIVPAEFRPRGESAGGDDEGSSGTPSDSAGGQSQLAANNNASRSTAGGQRPTSSSTATSNGFSGGGFGSPGSEERSPFSLGPQIEEEDPLNVPDLTDASTLPGDPLEIPEPDLSLDPGGEAMTDPLATTTPPSDIPAEDTPPQNTTPQEAPPARADTAPESQTPQETAPPESVASATAPQPPAPSETATPKAPADTPMVDPAPETFIGVNDAPLYVGDEVSESLAQAQAAEQTFHGSDGSSEAGQQYYSALTDLAEKLTYADPLDSKIGQSAQQAKQMLGQGNLRERAKLLATHGPARLSAKKEDRPDSGIVLFGQVQTVEKQGALYETRLEMPTPSGRSVVPLFSKTEPAYKDGARIIALGTLVDDPGKRLSGYEGGLPSVIWVGETVVLGQ